MKSFVCFMKWSMKYIEHFCSAILFWIFISSLITVFFIAMKPTPEKIIIYKQTDCRECQNYVLEEY